MEAIEASTREAWWSCRGTGERCWTVETIAMQSIGVMSRAKGSERRPVLESGWAAAGSKTAGSQIAKALVDCETGRCPLSEANARQSLSLQHDAHKKRQMSQSPLCDVFIRVETEGCRLSGRASGWNERLVNLAARERRKWNWIRGTGASCSGWRGGNQKNGYDRKWVRKWQFWWQNENNRQPLLKAETRLLDSDTREPREQRTD